MAELGKIEKPSADQYKNDRKLILIPLLFLVSKQNSTINDYVDRYWKQAFDQVYELQGKIGMADYIFHEMLVDDKDIKKTTESYGCGSYLIIESALEEGTKFKVIEDRELFEVFMDWNRIIQTSQIMTKSVYDVVSENYKKSIEARDEYLQNTINKELGPQQTALLFLEEGHKLQFDPDIQVFYVSPPALDELEKYVRSEYEKTMKERQEKAAAEKKDETPAG